MVRKSLSKQMYEMAVGAEIEFPVERISTVQSIASTSGLRYDRKYTTETDRVKRAIKVKRLK